MEFEHTEDIKKGETIFTLRISESEFARHVQSLMEKEMLKTARSTNKISDQLMFLSELALSIELLNSK